jgi:hypothetical protein
MMVVEPPTPLRSGFDCDEEKKEELVAERHTRYKCTVEGGRKLAAV